MTQELIEKDIDIDLKLNSYGEVDIDYYCRKAKAMQAQALSELFTSARKAVSNRLHGFYETYICRNCAAGH